MIFLKKNKIRERQIFMTMGYFFEHKLTGHLLFTGPEKENLMKQPWFIGLLISIIGVTLWFALCIFVVWLCKKRKAMKKQKMQEMYSGKSPQKERYEVFS